MRVASLRSTLPLSEDHSWVRVASLRSALSLGNTQVWVRISSLRSTLSLIRNTQSVSWTHGWVKVVLIRGATLIKIVGLDGGSTHSEYLIIVMAPWMGRGHHASMKQRCDWCYSVSHSEI